MSKAPVMQTFHVDSQQFARAVKRSNKQLLRTLPWRTRMRLWRNRHIDRTASWLIVHRQERAAVALWSLFGLWHKSAPQSSSLPSSSAGD